MYSLVFLGRAVADLERIDPIHRRLIKAKLLILAENPAALATNIKRLGGQQERLYRLRVGSYRVVFKREDERLVILIVRVGHRREEYR